MGPATSLWSDPGSNPNVFQLIEGDRGIFADRLVRRIETGSQFNRNQVTNHHGCRSEYQSPVCLCKQVPIDMMPGISAQAIFYQNGSPHKVVRGYLRFPVDLNRRPCVLAREIKTEAVRKMV